MEQVWKKNTLKMFQATMSLINTSFLSWWYRAITKYHDIYLFLLDFTIKSKFLIYTGLLNPHLNPSTFKTKHKQTCLYFPREEVTTSSTFCLLRKQLLPQLMTYEISLNTLCKHVAEYEKMLSEKKRAHTISLYSS